MKWKWSGAWLLSLSLAVMGCDRVGGTHEASKPSEAEHHATVHLVASVQQTLGVTVAAAELKPLEQTLQVTGQIAQDTDRLVHVNAPEAGTVTKLLVTLGERVAQGHPVAEIQSTKPNSPLEVTAPISGLILGIHATLGASVDPLTSLLTIADLSQVWATFDLYEQDAGVVATGQRIDARSVAYPERAFPGKVIFISPQVDPHTRTIKVRAQIENPDYALKLGMFVTGALYIPIKPEALLVPHAAVQRLGEQTVVFVQTEPETFHAREVTVGQQTRTHAEILEGVQAGERVVAEGSFHLKAELLKSTFGEAD